MSSPPLSQRVSRWLVPIAGVLILAYFLYFTPPGLLGKADALGYAVCHRIDERSFHIDGRYSSHVCAIRKATKVIFQINRAIGVLRRFGLSGLSVYRYQEFLGLRTPGRVGVTH